MARSHILRRFVGVLVLASMTVTLVAAPASASGTTRWVDDDGTVGTSSCDGTKAAKKHIQAAVDDSGPNDTVKVCPGTYVEKVTISGARDGLTLMSTKSHQAIIKAKDETTYDTITMVTVTNVDDVTVRNFSIQPLRDPDGPDYCDHGTGVGVSGSKNVAVSGNEIKPSGTGAFCGVWDGVDATAATTGTIKDNTITDYLEDGIHLGGSGTNVTVSGNTVNYIQKGLDPAAGPAIMVDTSAKGAIDGNTLNGPGSGPDDPYPPAAGVELQNSANGTTISNNTIAHMVSGINVYAGSGGSITDNVITGGQEGLGLENADNMTISGNKSSAATSAGLYVQTASTGNKVHDNDFRTNKNGIHQKDCLGQTHTGTNNTWTNNLGNSSSPAVLCAGRPPH